MKEFLFNYFLVLAGIILTGFIIMVLGWFLKIFIIGWLTWDKMQTEEKERDLEKRMRSKRP